MVDGEGRREVFRLIHIVISSKMSHSTNLFKRLRVYLHRNEASNHLYRTHYLQQERIFLKQNDRTSLLDIVNEWDGRKYRNDFDGVLLVIQEFTSCMIPRLASS